MQISVIYLFEVLFNVVKELFNVIGFPMNFEVQCFLDYFCKVLRSQHRYEFVVRFSVKYQYEIPEYPEGVVLNPMIFEPTDLKIVFNVFSIYSCMIFLSLIGYRLIWID